MRHSQILAAVPRARARQLAIKRSNVSDRQSSRRWFAALMPWSMTEERAPDPLALHAQHARAVKVAMSEGVADDEVYIDLAAEVLRSRQLDALQALKDFLTILPSPAALERVLARAASRTAALDCQSGLWLCHHADALLPELDLAFWARQCLRTYWQHCNLTGEPRLPLSATAAERLRSVVSTGDRLLLNQLLDLDL